MGVLYLLRHGDAGLGGPALDDHDRPLNPAGQGAVLAIGRHMAELAMRLDQVLCSTALRTRQTWEGIARCLDNPPEAEYLSALYLSGAVALQQRIRALPEAAETVMIIGHNPGLHEAAVFYCGAGDDVVVSQLHLNFPPAALAVLHFQDPWAKLSGQTGRLQKFVGPPDL
jgi:phosphohistidine phosphatase